MLSSLKKTLFDKITFKKSSFKTSSFIGSSFNNRGVTLTEVLLAMTIMAVALIPTIGLFNTGFKGTHKQLRFINALEIAEDELNNAIDTPWKDIAEFSKEIEREGITYTVDLKITIVDAPGDPIKLTYLYKTITGLQSHILKAEELTGCILGLELIVTWKDLIGKERSISLKTLKTRTSTT